jgi:hypothetical protein
MPLNTELRERLADYLSGAISLAEFQAWFAPRAWELTEGDPAYGTATRVELLLAEYLNGHRTEGEVAARLRPMVDTYVVAETPARFMTGASDTTVHSPVTITVPSTRVGTPLLVVHA